MRAQNRAHDDRSHRVLGAFKSELVARRVDQVLHQSYDRRRTGSTRIKGYPARHLFDRLKVHVARKPARAHSPESDVDLLWRPRNAAELERGTALLAAWEKSEGRRADGEILFADPAGRELGVSWREWATARSGRVLVKTLLGARLCEMRDLRSLLPRSATEAMPCASFWP